MKNSVQLGDIHIVNDRKYFVTEYSETKDKILFTCIHNIDGVKGLKLYGCMHKYEDSPIVYITPPKENNGTSNNNSI